MIEEKSTRSKRYNNYKEETEKEIKQPIRKDNKEKNEIHHNNPLLNKIILIGIFIIILFIMYISLIGTKVIETKEYKVESTILPSSFHGIKIVQFSDIHYGTTINKKQLDIIVTKINNLKPDIIIFTGDLIDKNITSTDNIKKELIDSLSKLECSLYKYAIYGNEDYTNKDYKEIITTANFTLLDNESTLLYYKDTTPILITGYNSQDTSPNYTIITNLVNEINTSKFYKIVLSHEPDSIDNFIIYKPNLVLSGHSLGGLIELPFIKPLFLNKGSKNYYKDYYKINDTDFYISNGLGTSGINARFNNHPSISLYRLYKTKESN